MEPARGRSNRRWRAGGRWKRLLRRRSPPPVPPLSGSPVLFTAQRLPTLAAPLSQPEAQLPAQPGPLPHPQAPPQNPPQAPAAPVDEPGEQRGPGAQPTMTEVAEVPEVRVHADHLDRNVAPVEMTPSQAVALAREGPDALRRQEN